MGKACGRYHQDNVPWMPSPGLPQADWHLPIDCLESPWWKEYNVNVCMVVCRKNNTTATTIKKVSVNTWLLWFFKITFLYFNAVERVNNDKWRMLRCIDVEQSEQITLKDALIMNERALGFTASQKKMPVVCMGWNWEVIRAIPGGRCYSGGSQEFPEGT